MDSSHLSPNGRGFQLYLHHPYLAQLLETLPATSKYAPINRDIRVGVNPNMQRKGRGKPTESNCLIGRKGHGGVI
tara:strand:- start:520 stop:744 length:225 start_codon:yes stop_codon:yes gene_type:complete